ncbi:MAG: hypothetical protein WC109_00745 [Syntrophomonadaceae bacterium]|nr:hypothetical protein [Syntrophomonadaceae bacterium]MDD3897362.1 hypothetical protein [Syntrophomonadaceae bacterium]MDD4562149.1 hypothetical protein [Syntrophomonadaceae bacterium]
MATAAYRNKIYSNWHERYMEQIGVDFSVEPLTMEETNETWRKAFCQESAPEEYDWSKVYLESLDDIYSTGNTDYRLSVEEYNEELRKNLLNVVNMDRTYKRSCPRTA